MRSFFPKALLAATTCFCLHLWVVQGSIVRGDEVKQAMDHARSLSLAFRKAAESTMPSVVTVISESERELPVNSDRLRELLNDPRYRRLFPDGELPFDIPGEEGSEGATLPPAVNVGSGVIIDREGFVLTNNHVVANADKIIVRLPDGRELAVANVQTDELSDLAVLKLRSSGSLPAAELGNSADLQIGDWVIAIGSPFELEATVSAGIISGKGRGIDKIRRGRLLQTDAAINPGNSGGPLVDLSGRVVGINTAIASNNGGYQGIGFAIPVDRAKWVARELLEHGRVRRAFLGIHIDVLLPETAKKLRLPPRSGVFVSNVMGGSPAETAGMQINDVIVEFAGEPVRGPRDLQDVVERKPIDSKQSCKIMRNGEPMTLDVVLKPLPKHR
jgi:serine protease Do